MKKLMIAAAIVCAAAMSQAATATWSASNIQGPAGGNGSVGWLVQVFDAGTTYNYEDVVSGKITALFSEATVAQGTTGAVKVSQAGVGSFEANDTGSWYAVIYDADTVAGAKNYIVSADADWTCNAQGKNFSVAFGSMTGTTTANKFLNSEWQSVPEPTSGLLLLLGVAGLALRRRRA